MAEAHEARMELDQEPGRPPFRGANEAISHDFVEAVSRAIAAGDARELEALVSDLPQADVAELLLALTEAERPALVSLLGPDFDFAALTELDETVRLQIIEALPAQVVADGLGELDSDDAVYILEDLDEADAEAILAQIPAPDRVALRRSLEFPEDSAGRLMQTDFIAVPPFWAVGQAIDYMRHSQDLPEDFYEIFVVDPEQRLLGSVPLNRILRSKRPVRIESLMEEGERRIQVTDDQEEVARLFERYNLISAAVVDEDDRLVGVITVDDVVDVIREEAGEDLSRLAGVGDEEISDPVLVTMRSRIVWLVVNLGTALLASSVISVFEGSISQVIALAVLMPIVASLGGNAGTQAMAVAVRALAVREISAKNVARLVRREGLVGLLNGVSIAVITGVVAGLWFRDAQIGVVIGMAMIINLTAAGLAGILVPLTLNRFGADPAVASSVFVTMTTDVVGFLAFLGLATWWLGLA